MAQRLRESGALKFLFVAQILQVRTPVGLSLTVRRMSILVGLNHRIFLSIFTVFVYCASYQYVKS